MKKIIFYFIIYVVIIFYLSCVNLIYASSIKLDGTLGSSGNIDLQGPEYIIKAEFGEQKGSNLFHSFQSFNLQAKETAIFQGSSNISNIFSRVTGGEASYINGTIKSEIAGANFYFLNPSGIMFGPESSLDISGSFHASTSHYLSFSNNHTFFSSPLQTSVLTSSPPSAFGFLNDSISPISIEGYGEITEPDLSSQSTGLAVKNGQTLSLIGGNIDIAKGSFYNSIETVYDYSGQAIDINVSQKTGALTAINGQINLISIASKGEIYIQEASLDTSFIQSFGSIKVMDKSLLDVTGDSPRGIYIRGGDFVVSDSYITANATGSGDSGVIDMKADNIMFTNGSRIIINNNGSGNSADIRLIASEQINFSGENNMIESSGIDSLSIITDDNGGDCGSIFMQAENILFSDGATIVGNTYGGGKGSDVTLIANNSIVFQGSNSNNDVSKISLETHSNSVNAGNGGEINIKADSIVFYNGALINCLVFGHGSAGNIYMNGTKQVQFSGNNNDPYQTFMISNLFEKELPKNPGGVIAFVTPFSNGGNGADITIEGGDLSLIDSCLLLSCTFGVGDSGNISIRSNGTVFMDDALAPGAWWNACITTGTIPYGPVFSGDGGDIYIQSKNLLMSGGAAIDCGVVAYYGEKSGSSGNITIDVSDTIRLSGVNSHGLDANDLNDDSNTRIFAKTVGLNNTSDAGNISIKAGTLVIENGAMISASTNTNTHGGNIDIQVDHDIFISGDSSNERYIPGEGVRIFQNSGIFSRSYNQDIDSGASGKITLLADRLLIENHASISTSSEGGGKSGNITLSLNTLDLNNNSSVSSSSRHTAHGGDAGTIVVNAAHNIYLRNNSQLTTETIHSGATHDDVLSGKILLASNDICLLNSTISTSVNGGKGHGGDIQICNSNIITLNKSSIIANAYKGTGGNILIDSKHIVQSTDSLISASSELGIDGNIHIDSSFIDFNSSLATFPSHFLDASKWIQTPCSLRSGKNISKFFLSKLDGLPPSLDDWLASIYPLAVMQDGIQNHFMIEVEEYFQNGNYITALNLLEKRTLYAVSKNVSTDIHIRKSDIYKKLGHYQKALSELHLALSNKNNNTHIQNAILYDRIVDCSLLIGDTENIYDFLNKFQEEMLQSKKPYLHAAFLNSKAVVNAINDHHIEAISEFEESLNLINNAYRNNFHSLKSKVLINRLRAYDMVFKKELTLQAFNDAFQFVNSLPESFDAVCNMISLGILAISLQNKYIAGEKYFYKKGFELLNKAYKLAPKYNCHRIASYAAGYIGRIYLNNNQLSDAVLMTQKAIFHSEQAYLPECLYFWQWQMGKIHRQYQNIEKSISYYQQSISTINALQQEIIMGYRDQSDVFVSKIKPLYLELTSMLLERAEQSNNQQIYQQRLAHCIQILDSMKSAQIQNYFKDECLYTNENKGDIQSNILSNEVVLYPILLNNHMELLLIFHNQLKRIKVEIDSDIISKTILSLRRHIENWEEIFIFINDAKNLYEWIIRPIEKELTTNDVQTIIISPDGQLCLLPFSVLYDGNQYLIQKYAIAMIPSISLMNFQQKSVNDNQVLLNGLSEARRGEFPLPGVKKELIGIHNIIGGEMLLDQSFTKDNLTELFYSNNYSIIHFATHGYFGHSSKDTFLMTYNGQLTMNDLETLISRIMYRGNTVDLLTLSACQTALGDAQAAFGIAGITLKAGVKTAVASLWSVDDRAACYVFTEFYRQIKQTEHTKAVIMQNICKMMIDHNDYYRPVFWAPFLVIGDWKNFGLGSEQNSILNPFNL